MKPNPDKSANELAGDQNLRATAETYCVADYDIYDEMPTFTLVTWPETTTSTTTTVGVLSAKEKSDKYTKCCVARVKNDIEYGDYCISFGAVIGCFQEMAKVIQRRRNWLRLSPEYSDAQLDAFYEANGELDIEELKECTEPKCNVLPMDQTQLPDGSMKYNCPWQKEEHELAKLDDREDPKPTMGCYATIEKDIYYPPLVCNVRDFDQWNFCKNDRTWEGRLYTKCCTTTYVSVEDNDFLCKLTGLPARYPGGCNSYLARLIAPLNRLTTQATQPRVWSECDAGNWCNSPYQFSCPVEINEKGKKSAAAVAVAEKAKPVVVTYYYSLTATLIIF